MKEQKNTFSVKRFVLALREETLTHSQGIMMVGLSLAIVLFLYGLIAPEPNYQWANFHTGFYALVLFVGEFWILKNNFLHLRDRRKNYLYFTLPASNLEKFLAKLSLTSIGYVAAISLLFYIVSCLVLAAHLLMFGVGQPIFDPFTPTVLRYIEAYFLIHAVFFLGGVYFRKQVLSKTILVLVAILVVVLFILWLFSAIFLHSGNFFGVVEFANMYLHFLGTLFLFCLVPFCWVVSYLRFCELEVA